jgi:hypothetical protein
MWEVGRHLSQICNLIIKILNSEFRRGHRNASLNSFELGVTQKLIKYLWNWPPLLTADQRLQLWCSLVAGCWLHVWRFDSDMVARLRCLIWPSVDLRWNWSVVSRLANKLFEFCTRLFDSLNPRGQMANWAPTIFGYFPTTLGFLNYTGGCYLLACNSRSCADGVRPNTAFWPRKCVLILPDWNCVISGHLCGGTYKVFAWLEIILCSLNNVAY